MFDNRMLRRIFGSKRDEVIGDWRKLYPSPNIIRTIKSRRMTWAGNVAGMGQRTGASKFWCGDLREGDHLKDPD
jgi:hypothetical protein